MEIVNSFNSLTRATGVQVPEVAIQTTLSSSIPYATYRYITNGIIPYVQAMTPTPYYTLLIISYLTSQMPSIKQYVVLPTEQVTALLYFPKVNNLPHFFISFYFHIS